MRTDAGSLEEFRSACGGQPYRALVELYAVRHGPDALAAQVRSARAGFSAGAGRGVEGLYNAWNYRGQQGDVLALDCREAMDRVVTDARRLLPEGAGDRTLVQAFRLVTLGLALTASLFPETRRAMGVQTAGELLKDPSEGEG